MDLIGILGSYAQSAALAIVAISLTAVVPSRSQENRTDSQYQARYVLAGYLLRSTYVCKDDGTTINTAFGLLSSPALKALSTAYKQTTESWMMEGSQNFNSQVMREGLQAACASMMIAKVRAEEIVRREGATAPKGLDEAKKRLADNMGEAQLGKTVEAPRARTAYQEYKESMSLVRQQVDLAVAARLCGFRNENYLQTFKVAAMIFSTAEAKRLGIPMAQRLSEETQAHQVDEKRRIQTGNFSLDSDCRKLRDSGKLDMLDQVKRNITGNYH
jgi:hypothetical protein